MSAPPPEPVRIAAKKIRSLCFQGDGLVDWVAGGRRLGLDGSEQRARVFYAYRFDHAVSAPSGRHVVLCERLGTKGLVVDAQTARVVRELDRSYYHAHVYVFPVALWTAPSGHTLLAHCPNDYNRIEIDDLDTGERLTGHTSREPGDYFHSRLAVSPAGTRMLTAGWVWHPWDFVGWFDLGSALEQPTTLDEPQIADEALHVGLFEEASAAWMSDDTLLVGSSDEVEDPEEVAELGAAPRLFSPGVAVLDVVAGQVTHAIRLQHPPGAMLPVGTEAVVTFYEHPRLYRLSDGALLHAWPGLPTGTHTSSIQHHLPPPPPMALDPLGTRFAVALEEEICVVDLSGWSARARVLPP